MENPAHVIGQVSEKVFRATETVVDLGRRTIESVDAHRQPMAATLEQTASALHAMSKGAGNLVRRYPAQSLAIAALAGFLVARTLGRRADRG